MFRPPRCPGVFGPKALSAQPVYIYIVYTALRARPSLQFSCVIFPFRPLVPAYAFSFIYMLNVTRLTGERPSCHIVIRIFRIFPLFSAAGPALPRRNIYIYLIYIIYIYIYIYTLYIYTVYIPYIYLIYIYTYIPCIYTLLFLHDLFCSETILYQTWYFLVHFDLHSRLRRIQWRIVNLCRTNTYILDFAKCMPQNCKNKHDMFHMLPSI